MRYFIGIDVGTSSAKVTIINEVGLIIGESSKAYRISEPYPGWKEIDPDTWMKAVDEAMEELIGSIKSDKISGIGVTGQMHTVVFIGKNGKSVRPALMWNDTRTSEIIPELKCRIRGCTEISHLSHIISTGSPAANLLWLKEHEPHNFEKISKFIIGPDYIVYRLTGKVQTDYCEASTSSLFNLLKKEWAPEIRRMLDFPEDIYPEIRGAGEIAGEVLPYWSEKYGLNKNVKVIVGTGDNPAAAISTGCLSGGYPVLSLGTSGVLMVPKKKTNMEAKGKNIIFSLDKKNIYTLVQGVVQSCGSSMNWWIQDILNSNDIKKEADIDEFKENNLLFYPHLTGDKTIYAEPMLRGAFLGLGTDTTRKEMTFAVMEGIAFGIRQLMEEMQISTGVRNELPVTGGGSGNPVWMQILADILNIKTTQLESAAGAGYGIALAAAWAVMGVPMGELLKDTVNIKKIFSPDEKAVKYYDKKYRHYCKIHDALNNVYAI